MKSTTLTAEVAAQEQNLAADKQFCREGEIFELSTIETKVVQLQHIAGQSITEIGRLLAWTKQRVGHGEFIKSLERVGFTARSAQAYIQVYEKLQKANAQPVAHLGISKALELMKNYEEEDLEALANGEEVDGNTLDDFAGMSRTELRATLCAERAKSKKELEAAQKQADSLQKRNDKLAQFNEVYQSGSDRGWEFTASYLERMSGKAQALYSAALDLAQLSAEWTDLVNGGDERALTGHPFVLANLKFFHSLIGYAAERCESALQRASAAEHPLMSDLQGMAMGFSRHNLPMDMKLRASAIEEAEAQEGEIPFQ